MPRRLFLAGLASSTLARQSPAAPPVVVGSKLDLEGGLLGEMMLLALGQANIATENRLRIGPTSILRAALLSGAIDLCPEYTGNAAFFFHEEGDPVWKDAAAGYARAAKRDYETNRLVWLAPAPADNSWVIAVPEALARTTKSSHHGGFRPLCAGRQQGEAGGFRRIRGERRWPSRLRGELWLPACRPASSSFFRAAKPRRR